MTLEHVFRAYDSARADPTLDYRFCPFCAAPLSPRPSDGRLRCAECGFVQFRNPFPGVSVLIVDGERVLLGRRVARNQGGGKWCLPGGFLEYDEDFLSAAVREVREETHLEIGIRSIANVVSNFLSPHLHTLVVVLLARVLEGTPTPGDDLSELAWFPLAGPLPEMAFEADRHIIQVCAGSHLGVPAHTGAQGISVSSVRL